MAEETFLSVRVTPRSNRDELQGWQDGVLRVRLKAPPIEGRANDALCRYLASVLAVPPSSVTIAGGAGSRLKRLRIAGLTPEEARARLGQARP